MSSVYADVIVDITNEKLDRTFQYKIPPELTGEIGPGTAVQIPFGNGNRMITGYVLSIGNEPKYPQDRMKAILAEAGATPADVTKVTVFIVDMAEFQIVNGVYSETFGADAPARSCVAVAALPKGARVEIEAIAVL